MRRGPSGRRHRLGPAPMALFLAGLFLVGCTAQSSPPDEGTPSAREPSTPGAVAPLPATPSPAGSLRLVGHTGLFSRGMNAGLAVWGDHAYVGSRTDGSTGHVHPGVVVVDIADPRHPKVSSEIGPPQEGNPGETSRELRVWPGQELLIVMNFSCRPDQHACRPNPAPAAIRFYDIGGTHADHPRLVSTYEPSRRPHEFFLWQDPDADGRALLYMSTPGELAGSLLVTDISGARRGRFEEIATWSTSFPDRGFDDNLHSLSVSPDGKIGYLAYLTAGFFMVDTSELAVGHPHPIIRPATPLERRAQWDGPGVHSAVPIPGRDLVLTTDEVYGGDGIGEGCPWGWSRIVDVADPAAPRVASEYRVLPYNDPAYCDVVPEDRTLLASFSSHNPTVTEHLALVSWHGAGLQAIATDDPARPRQVAEFLPHPLASVATEDPLLSSGPDKVVMWSYPVVQDGLIYVVDVRNGLYVLDYDGPHADELSAIRFLEGNSNVGDGMSG